MLHRDLKPANILVDTRGVARIADFGLAEAAPEIHGLRAREGTPRYMSPEQLAGRAASAASDVFALGLAASSAPYGFVADGGSSWAKMPLAIAELHPQIIHLTFNPHAPGELYVGTRGRGLFRVTAASAPGEPARPE